MAEETEKAVKEAKKVRGQVKAKLTKKRHEIENLLTGTDITAVDIATGEIDTLLEEFLQVQGVYHHQLSEATEKKTSDEYYASVDNEITHLKMRIDAWRRLVRQQEDIQPRDSVSRVGSVKSNVSAASRIRKECLKADMAALSKRQELDRQQFMLQQKRDEMELGLELEKANIEVTYLESDGSESSHASNSYREGDTEADTEATTDGDFVLQSKLMEVLQLPKVEIMTFDGNPMDYYLFIRNFESCVENITTDCGAKLTRLLQLCTGKAKKVVQCCAVMKPDQGYPKARKLLKERFGNDYMISEAWLENIIERSCIRPNDREALRDFSDELQNCSDTMEAVGCLEEINNQRSLLKIVEKLPIYLQNSWRKEAFHLRRREKKPTIDDLARFVEMAAEEANDPVYGKMAKQADSHNKVKVRDQQYQGSRSKTSGGYNFNSYVNDDRQKETEEEVCQKCSGSHTLFDCEAFKGLRPDERLELTRSHHLCDNCLRPGHMSWKCAKRTVCTLPGCGRKHTKFLHQLTKARPASSDGYQDQTGQKVSQNTDAKNGYTDSTRNAIGAGTAKILLPIVPVNIRVPGTHKVIQTYALLDSGSTSTFCCDSLIDKLGITGRKERLTLTTLEKKNSCVQTTVVNLEIVSMSGTVLNVPRVYSRRELPIGLENLATLTDIKNYPHLQGIELPDFGVDVSMLIGQDLPEAIIPLEIRRGKVGQPYASRTVLGWAINGPIDKFGDGKATVNFIQSDNDIGLQRQVELFWKVEDSGTSGGPEFGMSLEDKKAVAIWEETVQLLDDGHYQMRIPFKHFPPKLTNNRIMAEGRLKSLKRRLLHDEDLHVRYKDGMKDLLEKGYARQVQQNEKKGHVLWYLPHHPVINPKKPEKTRIVFDCAAKFRDTSLNDQVLKGPDLTSNLVNILIGFREEQIVITADIEAMFHQVKVQPEDTDVLRFLWWPEGNLNAVPKEYKMTSHLFGGVWSPSCCSYALRRTAADNQLDFETDVVEAVNKRFYVDDYLSSFKTEAEAIHSASQMSRLLEKGGFHLTKWITNSRNVLATISHSERAKSFKDLDLNKEALPVERTLGMTWDIEQDKFIFRFLPKDKALTRRGILSIVSSLYDPLGLVSPLILQAKLILQELSRLQLGWDEAVPETELTKWIQWLKDLPQIVQFSIPRCVKPPWFSSIGKAELHHFSDASEKGYGVVSYLRLTDSEGRVHCALILGKSRLAPLKTITLPRLELSAAVMATRIDKLICKDLRLDIQTTTFWTDSVIVLQYLANQNKKFQTFVANRISEIQDCTSLKQWRHVPTKHNPADDASRGLDAAQMISNRRWKNGPTFLWQDEKDWPRFPGEIPLIPDDDDNIKTIKEKIVKSCVTIEESSCIDQIINNSYSWLKLKKTIAWILRTKAKLRDLASKRESLDCTRLLTVEEIRIAEAEIVKYVQQTIFAEEYEALKSEKMESSPNQVKRSSSIFRLDPCLNTKGVLCVGGRLRNSMLSDEAKHQMVLPKSHHVVDLITQHFHKLYGHSGREHTLSLIRERFWIIKGRIAVAKMLRDCFDCRKRLALPEKQKMADLPVDRLTPDKPPFSYVGLDYFGPFHVKMGRSTVKRYGCIFTCLVVRAIHIEVAHKLDTDSFINALKRFICRRGVPLEIRCDNGTNFVGGERELREAVRKINCEKVTEYLLQREIKMKWKFNTPYASHMGGVWERLIRSVRQVLNALLKEQVLHDEALMTVFCEVEAVINSRPITTVSSDPSDEEPLTPNHLLLLRAGNIETREFSQEDVYCKRRWRQIQYLADCFWKRWTKEYLPSLQTRQKWQTPKRNLQPGDVVLLLDQNLPRNCWLMGIVVKTFPGRDSHVRSVQVRVRNTLFTRPINKLCLVEDVGRRDALM